MEAGINTYFFSFPVIDDLHVNEAIKLEHWIRKADQLLPKGIYEFPIEDDDFIGYADLLHDVTDECVLTRGVTKVFDLYDFKYSNNVESYLKSGQLHEYKYYIEKNHPGWKIRKMFFVFFPKVTIKQRKDEDIFTFRQRLKAELDRNEIQIVEVVYDPTKVIDFVTKVKRILELDEFPKEESRLCAWCEYQEYCEKGVDYMLLPANQRRNIQEVQKKVIWIYGAPFSGKTTLANKFPDPLMLNTDGNIKYVDAPYIPIKDKVTVEGRQTKRQLAWAVFKEVVDELEKKQNDFKTIVVDLLEDLYEHCRLYIYDKRGWEHESDDSFKAWDIVRTEFLSTIKRLVNLDYENIVLISHEDRSKDLTKKGGDKLSTIRPNLAEKPANKIAGMVDIVARVIAEDDRRVLSFKTSEVIFGGGRLKVTENEIPLDYDALMEVYAEANRAAAEDKKDKSMTSNTPREKKPAERNAEPSDDVPNQEAEQNASAGEAANFFDQKVQEAEPATPAAPTTPQRKRRGQ